MKKKKIIITMVNLYNGGAEKSLVNLLNEFNFNEYEIDLLLFQKKGLFLSQIPKDVTLLDCPIDLRLLYNNPSIDDFKSIKNIKLILIRIIGIILSKLNIFLPYRKKRQVRWKYLFKNSLEKVDKEYDVAIAYIEGEPTYYVCDKINAKKKFVWVHNDYKQTGLDYKLDYEYFKRVDNVVTISDKCLKILQDIYPDIKNKFIHIPNITSSKNIINMSNKQVDFPYTTDGLKILSIGRLNYQKGFDLAISAAKILKMKNYKFEWYIIGDGELRKKLLRLIKKNKLDKNVFLIGVKENPYAYMKRCDLIVQTSRFEGKSVVLDEAKILNKPVLSTNYDTVYDQLDNSIAIITEMNDEKIALAIEKVIKEKDLLKEYKENLKTNKYGNEKELIKYYNLIRIC